MTSACYSYWERYLNDVVFQGNVNIERYALHSTRTLPVRYGGVGLGARGRRPGSAEAWGGSVQGGGGGGRRLPGGAGRGMCS